MTDVLWSASALRDLQDIHGFIAEDSLQRADGFIRTIQQKSLLLSTTPAIGKLCPALADGIRSWPLGNYLIFRARHQHRPRAPRSARY